MKIYKFLINFNYVNSFDIFMINQVRKYYYYYYYYFIFYVIFVKPNLTLKEHYVL